MTDINSIGNARLIIREVSKVIVGKDESLIKILLAIISGGHILMEDIPGVGKTTMAISVSRALGLDYNRVQFTPDVLPSDITGFSIYDKETGKMNYQKGAVLCNLFLADELNRATSRTQSALLQAMEEGMVTSNEPGVYFENEFGVRCENLMLCVKDEKNAYGQFMRFETLTMVPWELDAIIPSMLNDQEKALLNAYHAQVYENIAPFLEGAEKEWLREATRAV